MIGSCIFLGGLSLATLALGPVPASPATPSLLEPARPVGLFEMICPRDDKTGNLARSVIPAEGAPGLAENAGEESSNLQVVMGAYNPFLEQHRRGDPTGPGFNKLHSRWQVLDWGCTKVRLGLDAMAPAAMESGGIPAAPTVVSPGLSLSQDFGDGIQLQGHVGQSIQAYPRWSDDLDLVHASVKFECPLLGPETRSLFFFIQAVGDYRVGDYRYPGEDNAVIDAGRHSVWEFTPGIQWRFRDKSWMSVGASRWNLFTLSWEF